MQKEFIRFSLRLLIIATLVFSLQLFLLYFYKLPLFDNLIVEAYIFNIVLAMAFYLLMLKLPESLVGSAGFIFLGSSFVKFALFFLIFNPNYKADGEVDKLEFFAFFTPYATSLFFEIFCLVRWLNKR